MFVSVKKKKSIVLCKLAKSFMKNLLNKMYKLNANNIKQSILITDVDCND